MWRFAAVSISNERVASNSKLEKNLYLLKMKALMDKVVHDDDANNDEENDSELNENIHFPGKPGGTFRICIKIPYSFLFSEFCFRIL
jgi:hypothetical protein